MWDVIVAGGGPAGSVAAALLARAGARVLLVDRARFPRDKLCGDSLNPGTVSRLERLFPGMWTTAPGLPALAIDGMRVSGPFDTLVDAPYPRGLHGRTLPRRALDGWLLEQAARAGAQVEDGVTVRRPLMDDNRSSPHVSGIVVRGRGGGDVSIRAAVTIGADGRRSVLASTLGLARALRRPARWAVGAYYEGVAGMSTFGEMHVRSGRYVGLAPLPGGLTNVCLVAPAPALQRAGGAERALSRAVAEDPMLAERFVGARAATRPAVLGPLGVDGRAAGVPGLLLAGDAAGFVDPMTGDGLRFAVEGAEIAADVALGALARGGDRAHVELARRRHAAFAGKWRLNRALRLLVDQPAALAGAACTASVAPALVRLLVAAAGDCAGADRLKERAR
jgi:flavin-dependent dehydrogenase